MRKIERKTYMEKLLDWKDKQVIKVVRGVRRCGKSTLLEMYQDRLRAENVDDSQIIAINMEDFDFIELRDPKELYRYVNARLVKEKKCYVFLDEIQRVENYADVVDALFVKDNVDLYLTGSNAYMLPSEIATLLSGRYVEIKMQPLSFSEYVAYMGDWDNLADKYKDYITNSSFPYTLELRSGRNLIGNYLDGIYNTVVMKDVMQRKEINDAMMLESVVRFVMSNAGITLSTKKIAEAITSSGRKVDSKTVELYLQALCESFILYKVQQFNFHGIQMQRSLEKYYLVDVALRRALPCNHTADMGQILENVVFLELQRRYQYVGKMDDTEVDFVAIDEDRTSYFQVSVTTKERNTLIRKLAPLKAIANHNPKYLLTLDNDPEINYNGIKKMNALQWLLGGF